MRWMIIFILGLLALSAQAASFDCNKASTKVEKMICSDPELSKLDDDLGKYYHGALAKADDTQKKLIVLEEKRRLKDSRNVCQDKPCLKKAYISILEYLAAFAGTELPPEAIQNGQWIYRDGGVQQEKPLCQNLLKRLNKYDSHESLANRCSWNVIASYPKFTVPPWEKLDSKEYEDLITKLEKYWQEGPDGYFHKLHGLNEGSDTFYRSQARDFIKYGGRLEVWRTTLSSSNSANPRYNNLSSNKQTIVRMSGGYPVQPPSKELDARLDAICKGVPRAKPRGEIFYVTSDLTGPDPTVDAGTFGIASGHDLMIYEGKPIFVGEESIWRDSQVGLVGYCSFEFEKGEK